MNDEIIKWITYLTVRHDFYNLPQESVNVINAKKLLNDIESQTISTVDFMQNPLKFLAAYEIEIDEERLSQYNAAGSFHKKLLDNNAHHSEFLSQLSDSLHSPDSTTSL
jgi:NAD-dependent SIR2 family protein deacetylase